MIRMVHNLVDENLNRHAPVGTAGTGSIKDHPVGIVGIRQATVGLIRQKLRNWAETVYRIFIRVEQADILAGLDGKVHVQCPLVGFTIGPNHKVTA